VEFCHFPVNATFFTLNATLFSGNSWQVVANLGTGLSIKTSDSAWETCDESDSETKITAHESEKELPRNSMSVSSWCK
jgi:hypothetical protein